jgi:C4-dicarboxylate-specific signal transduction histidine kinase
MQTKALRSYLVFCAWELKDLKVTDFFGDQAEVLAASGFHEEIRIKRKDGYYRFVSASTKALKLKGKPVSFCILHDVTDKKQMERELITKHTELRDAYMELEKVHAEMKAMQETLIQSGKLAALGELAAGIAHELNQPLTAVKGFAQEAREVLATNDQATALKHLNEVVGSADKMEKIISHLRNFTRKSTEDFQWVDIQTVIDESLVMLDKQFRSRGIEIEKNYSKDLPQVYCNPFQLEQVFINLSTNARDAIEQKQKLDPSAHAKISIQAEVTNDHFLQIRFSDNGVGIPEHVKAKIFNPFFTTKEVGKGMGLGLSISYGILSRIHASVMVESTPGTGTTFIIKLPLDYRKH